MEASQAASQKAQILCLLPDDAPEAYRTSGSHIPAGHQATHPLTAGLYAILHDLQVLVTSSHPSLPHNEWHVLHALSAVPERVTLTFSVSYGVRRQVSGLS